MIRDSLGPPHYLWLVDYLNDIDDSEEIENPDDVDDPEDVDNPEDINDPDESEDSEDVANHEDVDDHRGFGKCLTLNLVFESSWLIKYGCGICAVRGSDGLSS